VLSQLFSRLFAVWLALTLIFFALRILPGDAITAQLIEIGMTEQQIANRRAEFGLDQPVITQYVNYWGNLLRGDLGTSLSRDV
jgi:ABC-type dipeptide/oligopeptide/nickel transport system permease component